MSEAPLQSLDAPIGLIGVGLLGSAIAERLSTAGWRVTGWDVDPGRLADLEALGGTAAEGAGGVVGACDRILLSLPNDEVAAEVLRSIEGALRAGQVVVDTSTGSPEAAVEQARRLRALGVSYLDATVSGSSRQLRDGEAVLMVGADDEAFEACRELFARLAARTLRTGPPGSGARMKLVTNLVLGLNRAALAEGLAFAEAVGVDPSAALAALAGGAAYSRAMDVKGRKMIEGDFAPQARLSQHLKDVRLILSAAEAAGLALPLSQAHRGLLERAEAGGLGGLDNSAVIEAIRGPRP
ncbi:NAD(P)-dependent oxidoreductase [Paludisphaera soli]|uniref:NAD(P)-dependent oxidoreductase n=1 Tax=Paludisphaera soli TaxID=2712865 RepID=UPI0013EC4319|nr:NAD(P)-dependent oxidoreductase [Paludisphaera soli]